MSIVLFVTKALVTNAACHKQFSFTEDSTVVYTSCDSISLAATLAIPDDSCQRHPAVVLMSGTGPQDRDCTMAGHRLFRDISDYLASRGIAVLRTDDRGVGKSTGNYAWATTADFAADALAAVSYLKSRDDIDPKHIGLIGHSEGGASISIAASKSHDVAFIVSLCGLMTPGLESVIQQNRDIIASTPLPDADKQYYNDINERMFRTAYQFADSDSLAVELQRTYDTWRSDTTNNHIRFSIYMYKMTATTPWYRFFIRYDPAVFLSHVHVPVLLVNGGKDIMVNAVQNTESALRCLSHNRGVTARTFLDLNHLLLPSQYGTQEEYRQLKDVNTSPEVLQLLDIWIHQNL